MAAGTDALLGQDLGQRSGSVAWLARQAEVLEPVSSHRQRGRAGRAPALVADQDRRIAVRADDEERFLEARIEAGEEREVRAVLAIGVHEQPIQARSVRSLAQALEPRHVQHRGDVRHAGRHAEVRQRDLRELRLSVALTGRLGLPRSELAGGAVDGHEPVRVDPLPVADRAVRPGHSRPPLPRRYRARSASSRAARKRGRRRPSARPGSCARRRGPRPTRRSHRGSRPPAPAARPASCPSAPAPPPCRRRRCARGSTRSRRLTTTRSSRPSRLRSTSGPPRARAKLTIPASSPPSTKVPSAWPMSRLFGSRTA